MITLDKSQIHFAFDALQPPCAVANPGDEVVFQCQDAYCEQILADHFDFARLDMTRNNPATGPLYVHTAQTGDVLRVEILSIDLASEGCMCARPGAGIYPLSDAHCRRFPIENGEIRFDHGIRLPVRPMVGVIGTAPAGEPVSTQSPGEHGGNLDIRDLTAGARLYLPVSVPGALLSMGDIHALQGDGESVICALEMSGSVTVKVEVLKNRPDIPTPFIVTPSHYLTTAAAPSLDEASRGAARKMQHFLQEHSPLSSDQAALLLSLAGNLRISQVVNPEQGCLMEFPRALAKETFIP